MAPMHNLSTQRLEGGGSQFSVWAKREGGEEKKGIPMRKQQINVILCSLSTQFGIKDGKCVNCVTANYKILIWYQCSKLSQMLVKQLSLFKKMYVHEFICTICMQECITDLERVSGSQELELQMVLRCHVGSGNGSQVLCKSSEC